VYTNQAKGDLGELRQTLQRGIEVVRVLGNHGLDVRLIVHLAQTFEQRVSAMLCGIMNYAGNGIMLPHFMVSFCASCY
jgi:hypothetical protein